MCGDFRQLPSKNVQMLDHFFPLLVPKDSESLRILDIRLWEVGAKRPLNGTSKVKKVKKKTFFCAAILDNFQTKCSYLRPILSITFPQGFQISKKIGHPTSGSGGKKTAKGYLKSEKSGGGKKTFFCAAILDNFQTKMFISETTSFHYFSHRIPNL